MIAGKSTNLRDELSTRITVVVKSLKHMGMKTIRPGSGFICLFFILLLCLSAPAYAQPYLSTLQADNAAPLYTTYAAALQRSQFVIDKGYHLVWNDGSRGIEFENRRAGTLAPAFALNGEFRYRLDQMHTPPQVTACYSDLVKVEYAPFEQIRVNIFFLVYSSGIAIQDIEILNQGEQTAEMAVYPFLYNQAADLHQPAPLSDNQGFSFHHHESADGWTVSHGVPFETDLLNVYLLDSPADSWGAYTALAASQGLEKPTQLHQSENYCVEWGRVYHADGSPCLHRPPQAQQIVLLNGSDNTILTESAPKWGDTDPNIPGNGFQGCELGNFSDPAISAGDSFTVIFTCLACGQQGTGRGVVPQTLPAPGGVHVDIQLQNTPMPPQPLDVSVSVFGGNAAQVEWQRRDGYLYSVYRCNLAHTRGKYSLMAKGLTDSIWVDFSLDKNSEYDYIVVARDSSGAFSAHSGSANGVQSAFFSDAKDDILCCNIPDRDITVLAMQKRFTIEPDSSVRLRVMRGTDRGNADGSALLNRMRDLRAFDLESCLQANEELYSGIPPLQGYPEYRMMYWSAFSMIRQCMLPPEGECGYNYYVFSREPTWGWGHGGQVFHESLTMLAYAFMAPRSAMNSQRIYMERQHDNGYINYRTGPYLNETIPHHGRLTTSAPWYNWINHELFKISTDSVFLAEAYQSGRKFYEFWIKNRDADGDGLCEWGAHAVLESVRDGSVVIWNDVGWPSHFECLDLNCMLVNEARALAAMAGELGYSEAQQSWLDKAEQRRDLINRYMWDEESGFYYHVDKRDHDYSYESTNDLKRMEIIGFLPLWAGIASDQQAERLLQHLTDPDKFWRRFGVPTLAADDDYYHPLGYWNGPVWVEWQYLLFRGLLRYGYTQQARQLMHKVCDQVNNQLKDNHWFWELYSPDDHGAGHHKTYIWSGLVARMLIDMQNITGVQRERDQGIPQRFQLYGIYPNPFNDAATIEYLLPQAGRVRIDIFNALGQRLRSLLYRQQSDGEHRVIWDGKTDSGKDCCSGLYFCQIRFNGKVEAGKMLLLR